MIEFEIKSKVLPLGKRKGQTVYYASPKSKQHMSNKMVVDRIVRETSLSAGDVSNALISLSAIVRDALEQGQSVDLAELGSLRLIVSSKMMDTEKEVTAAVLKTPKIQFTPISAMRAAAKAVQLMVDNPATRGAKSGTNGAKTGKSATNSTAGGDRQPTPPPVLGPDI